MVKGDEDNHNEQHLPTHFIYTDWDYKFDMHINIQIKIIYIDKKYIKISLFENGCMKVWTNR